MSYLNDFLKQQRLEGKSPQTLDAYQRDLLSFGKSLIDLSENYSPEQKQALEDANFNQAWLILEGFSAWNAVTIKDVQAFVAQRMQAGIAARSLARQLSALRSFFDFGLAQGWAKTNPAKSVKAPKQPKPLPKSLDVDLTGQLLDYTATPGANTWQNVRNQAIFEILYSAGLRVSECANLDLSPGLDTLQQGWVNVMGKGGKERLAPIGRHAMTALNAWLKIRAEHANEDEKAVFVGQSGTRLGVRTIQKALDDRTLEVGLPTKMSPHRLRHACATHVLESSGDLRAVQEMLGHANLSTTQIYTKLDLQHLAKVYDTAHPRAKRQTPLSNSQLKTNE